MKSGSVTQKLLKSHKKPLLGICVLLAMLCDWTLFGMLLYAKLPFEYAIFPMALGILDVILLCGIVFSGFRFRYSMGIPIAVNVVAVISVLFVFICESIVLPQRVMTLSALLVWGAFHVVAALTTILVAVNASGRGRGWSFVSWLFVVILVLAAGIYVYGVGSFGLFGQGDGEFPYLHEARTVVYELDEEGEGYEAVSVLEGRGGSVVIPQEFNGKKVTKVNLSLFGDETIEQVCLEGTEVALSGTDKLPETLSENLKIVCDRTLVDEFRTFFYDLGKSAAESAAYYSFANRFLPQIGEDEVYIIFDYTFDSYDRASGRALPTWIHKAGEPFDLEEYSEENPEVEYIKHANNEKEYDLCWSYRNMKGYIFKTLTAEDGSPLEGPIRHSATAKAVFERVYPVRFIDTNDTVYNNSVYRTLGAKINFVFDGENTGCRYVLASNANKILSEFPERDGFTLEWTQRRSLGGNVKFTDLSEVLGGIPETNLSAVSICPNWTLEQPSIEIVKTDALSGKTVYGERVRFTGQAKAPADGFTLSYEWRLGDVKHSDTADWTIEKVQRSQAGTYTLLVTASAGDLTSLSSQAEASVVLTVGKRPLRFTWTPPEDLIYSGTAKHVSCVPMQEDIASGDDIEFAITQNVVRDARQYTVAVHLNGTTDSNYEIVSSSRSCSFTVTPCPVSVIWEPHNFIYSGLEQCPEASVNGVGEDGPLSLTISGGKLHAGTDYTAHAALSGTEATNYTIINADEPFAIAKQTLTATWEGDRKVTYDGDLHGLTVTVNGAVNEERIKVDYSEKKIHASKTPYTMTASVSEDGDYIFEGETYSVTEQFTIDQREITLNWTEVKTLTYNGAPQGIRVISATNWVTTDQESFLRGITYSEEKTNAQDSPYTMTATLPEDGDYVLSGGVYIATEEFTIGQKEVSLVWQTQKSFFYTGKQQGIEAVSVTDVVPKDERALLESIEYTGHGTNAQDDPYTMTATLPEDGNYILSDGYTATEKFTIARAKLTIVWQTERRFVYNGLDQGIEADHVEGIVNDEDAAVNQALVYSGKAKNAGTHEMTVAAPTLSNYEITAGANCNFEIIRKTLELQWQSEREFVYSGSAHTLTATVHGTENDEVITPTYEIKSAGVVTEEAKNVGRYTITASIPEDGNYTFGSGYSLTEQFEITPKGLTIVWGDGPHAFEYTGDPQRPTATVEGAVGGEEQMVTSGVQYTDAPTNAGSYQVTAELGPTCSNYTIIAGKTCEFTITQKEISLQWQENRLFTYSGSRQGITGTVSGTVKEERITPTYTGYQTNARKTPYTMTASLPAEGNYKFAEGKYSVTEQFTIAQREITLNWAEERTLTYNGASQGIRVISANNWVLADRESFLQGIVYSGEKINAQDDPYTMTATLPEGGNYVLSGGGYIATEQFTIGRASLTIIWQTDRILTYNGAPQGINVERIEGVIPGEDALVKGKLQCEGKAQDVGEHQMTASLDASLSNYKIVSGETQDFTIEQKQLAITLSSVNKTYDGRPFDRSAFQYTYSALAGRDMISEVLTEGSLQYSGDAVSAKDAGTYRLDATVSSGGEKYKNYRITVTGTTVEIKRAELTLKWSEQTTFDYDGQPHGLTAEAQGAIPGEEPQVKGYVTLNGNATNAGHHTMTATLSEDSRNYVFSDLAEKTCGFDINPKALTITLTSNSKEYDGKPFEDFEYTHTDLASGDTIGEILTLQFTGEATTEKNAGQHTFTATVSAQGVKYGNYTLSPIEEATITISKKKVTLTWPTEMGHEEDGSSYLPEAQTVDGILEEESGDDKIHVEYHYYAADSDSEEVDPKDAGTYRVKAELVGEGADNYELDSASGEKTFEITAKETDE